MVTDLAEVFRLGTAKAEENRAFHRYLAKHHRSERPFQLVASEVQKQIDCTVCANCCRHSVVELNRRELECIASHLGISVEAAIRLYTEPDPEALVLRTLRNAAEACVFLSGTLCTIYEARPKACREFPHVAVGTHSLGGRPASLDRWAALCPIVYNALEQYKHLTGFPPHPRHHPT